MLKIFIKAPKKALWLAVKRHIKEGVRDFFSVFVVEEVKKQSEEMIVEGKKKKIPRGALPTMAIVTLSLLFIVSSSVMVSRATGDVDRLEYEIEQLQIEKKDLDGKLIENSDMIEIKRVAVEEYGMISGDYAMSKYIDVTRDEGITVLDKQDEGDSLLTKILKAIGFIKD